MPRRTASKRTSNSKRRTSVGEKNNDFHSDILYYFVNNTKRDRIQIY